MARVAQPYLFSNLAERPLKINRSQDLRRLAIECPADGEQAFDAWKVRATLDGTDLGNA
jgi:hypothetical protein